MNNYNFYTYILTNLTKTVLYVGVTNILEKRILEHYTGIDHKNSFTKKYNCYYLIYFEQYKFVQEAIAREKQLKGWVRRKKIALIEAENPEWRFLNGDVMEWPPNLTEA